MRHLLSLAGILLAAGALDALAQQPTPKATPPRAAGPGMGATARSAPPLLPGTRSNVFTTIQGDALNAANGKLPDAAVRLRDARLGRIVDVTTTDKAGAWAFRRVDPGSYVVELLGPDQTVVAATQLISLNAGDAIYTAVKLPYRVSALGGVLGPSAPSAAAVSTAAAASGVLATTVSGEPVSPVQ